MSLNYKDFIYSINIKKENPSATSFQIKFGVNDDSFWLFTLDIDEGFVSLGNNEQAVIKSTDHFFVTDRDYKLDLVVNSNVAKVYIDESDVASLVFVIEGYEGGEIVDNLDESLLTSSRKNITTLNTLSGDIFCSGYEVYKVINLTDGNYKLTNSEYSLNNGTLSINDGYLNTLENNTVYTFRAVTSLTDLDFNILTKEVGAQANSLIEKYHRGDDITFELSEAVTVNKVFIDSHQYEFEQKDELVTVKSEQLNTLESGDHVIKFFTNNGRPEAKFSLYTTVETLPEVTPPVNHAFFFIDAAIFAVLIIGYVAFSQIKKYRK